MTGSIIFTRYNTDYKKWNKLTPTLIGQIAAVKIKTLLQINYLFSMIPATPTDKWLKKLDSLTTHFYWNDKKTRLLLLTLQKRKHLVGLEALHFMHYFLANQLQYLYKWTQQQIHTGPWLDLERKLCAPIQLQTFPSYHSQSKKKRLFIITSKFPQL